MNTIKNYFFKKYKNILLNSKKDDLINIIIKMRSEIKLTAYYKYDLTILLKVINKINKDFIDIINEDIVNINDVKMILCNYEYFSFSKIIKFISTFFLQDCKLLKLKILEITNINYILKKYDNKIFLLDYLESINLYLYDYNNNIIKNDNYKLEPFTYTNTKNINHFLNTENTKQIDVLIKNTDKQILLKSLNISSLSIINLPQIEICLLY